MIASARSLKPAIFAPIAVAVTAMLAGCESDHPLMPLEVGRSTSYVVKFGFNSRVEPVKIVRKIAVAGTEGYELTGALGVSRVAWKDGVLFADRAVNATFEPSLPLLTEDGKERTWHGRVVAMGNVNAASARLKQEDSTVDIGGRKVKTTLATLTVQMPKGKIELASWYAPGTGLVQQEQRTNGERVIQIQMVTAP